LLRILELRGIINIVRATCSKKMLKRKNIREKGKVKLSTYFQEFEKGQTVAVVREHSTQPKFPKKLQGRTGKVMGKQGNSYVIKLKDLNKEKTYIIHPIHLKKIA
jgi:large subunit ribosomal protein L21e